MITPLMHTPVLALLTSLAASFITVVIGLFVGRRATEAFSTIIGALLFMLTFLTFVNVFFVDGSYAYYLGGWPPPVGIPYVIDHYSASLGLVVSLVFFLVILYSLKYIEEDRDVKWYYSLLLLMQGGMLGVIFAGDVFHIFVMLEVMGLPAFLLVPFRKELKRAVEAGMKYGIYDIFAISLYYLATALVYGMFGSMAIAEIAAKLAGYVSPFSGGTFAEPSHSLPVIAALFVWSFAIGSALVPQHFWLPDAHSMAPSSISAILSGLVVQINIAVLARLLFSGLNAHISPITSIGLNILLALGIISALYGSAFMLVQTDIKRFIAYSTIAHLGLIAIGFGVATATSVSAAVLHIINHAFVKAALFMLAGVFIHATGSRDIRQYLGISKTLPYATFLFLLAALAAIGFPPLSIFWSKLLLIYALVEKGGLTTFIIIPVFITIIFEAIAQIRMLSVMYGKAEGSTPPPPNRFMLLPVAILVAITIAIGFMPTFLIQGAGLAASDLLSVERYIEITLRTLFP
jgi:multicomponent Na+:H+ antiporter subunit D